jgi:hypothetical protein
LTANRDKVFGLRFSPRFVDLRQRLTTRRTGAARRFGLECSIRAARRRFAALAR